MIRRMMFLLLIMTILLAGYCLAGQKPRLFRTSSELIYMRVTEVIYKDSVTMDGGKKRKADKGSRFAEIVVNFANLTDKPLKDYGLQPVDITVSPDNLILIGDNKKGYSGKSATKLMAKSLNPFLEKKTLKPGEDIVRCMSFLIPQNVKITGVKYKFPGGEVLSIDYNDPSQIQPDK